MAFENIENMDLTIKQSFIYILKEWVRVHIGECSLSLMDFIDWLHST